MSARTGALDKALAERAKLESLAKAAQKLLLRKLYTNELYGSRLQDFQNKLTKFGSDDGDLMIEFVEREQRRWLHAAPYEFRCAALTACADRQMRVRVRQGLPALDDPLPGEPDSVFFVCKKVLGL